MAGAEVIGAAIGVLCLIIVGYVLVGSTLVTAEIVNNAQRDTAQQLQEQQRTNLEITNATIINDTHIEIKIKNTGQETIKDFNHLDVQMFNATTGYESNSWSIAYFKDDLIHPGILDPEETICISARYSSRPEIISVITGNGITTSHKFYL